MTHPDALVLSRLQWVWVIALHILLPAFTVGLASYIAVLEGFYLFTKDHLWYRTSRFWTKIFAVSFGMGVVSGIIMPFQFGTNWSRFSDVTANVLSPLMAYEGLTAFFLEASFLGILLFGRRLVPAWVHFFSAVMVASGTLFSTFWILSVNSWMQTPQGFEIKNGRFYPTDWLKIIFNPSFPYRYFHNVTGFYITTAFVVLGVSSYLLRQGKSVREARMMIKMALGLLIVIVPLQMLLGDLHGRNTLRYQPAKLAAIEGLYNTARPAPMTLFGIPDDKNVQMTHAIEIPRLGSLIVTHTWNGEIKGLKEWKREDRPAVGPTFYAFRVMVGIGSLMLLMTVVGVVLLWKDRIYTTSWFLRLCVWTSPLGFIAILAGWTTTEAGRQPWTVYGYLRTVNSVTPSLTTHDVVISLSLYVIAYLVMFPSGAYFTASLIRAGVEDADLAPGELEGGQSDTTIVGLASLRGAGQDGPA